MGFPVFTVITGPVAGYYVGKRMAYHNLDVEDVKKRVRRTSLFTASVTAVVCFISSVLALSEKTLPSQLTEMLNAPFVITWTMVWGIIIVGGALLIVGEYWATKFTVFWAYSRKGADHGRR